MSTGVDSHMGLRLWLRMLTTTNLVQAELRKRLRNEFDTTLPRFDLMAQLERHPEGLKMNELSRRLMVTGGNVTGLTDQLEKEGLVCAIPIRTTAVRSACASRPQAASRSTRWPSRMNNGLLNCLVV